jgi:ribosome maturation factor RimP
VKTLAVIVLSVALAASVAAQGTGTAPAPAAKPASPAPAMPKGQEAAVVTLRGTVEAVDKEKQTVTIKGPKRTLTIRVQDPKKLEAIKVGDPVVGKYYEAIAFEVKKPGTATPGVTAQQGVASSQPGATPAGAVGEQVTVTATITAIDKKAQTVTIKGPDGTTETVKARNPKNLDAVKVGDLVEITYTRALAIALDKPAKK